MRFSTKIQLVAGAAILLCLFWLMIFSTRVWQQNDFTVLHSAEIVLFSSVLILSAMACFVSWKYQIRFDGLKNALVKVSRGELIPSLDGGRRMDELGEMSKYLGRIQGRMSNVRRNRDELRTALDNLSQTLRMKEQQFLQLESKDSLTGIGNRQHLFRVTASSVMKAATHGHNPALLLLSLNGFKTINEEYGYDAGDRLLKEVSQRIVDEVRSQGVVGRVGGDEFAVLMPDTSRASARNLAEDILGRIRCPFVIDGFAHDVACSLGICCLSDELGLTKHQSLGAMLFHHAEYAMQRAKLHGGGCHEFFKDADASTME